MNNIRYIASDFGRCAIRFVHEHLDSVLPNYSTFLYRDQAYKLPTALEVNAIGAHNTKFSMPMLGYGVYGREPDGTYTLLASCIDSSD